MSIVGWLFHVVSLWESGWRHIYSGYVVSFMVQEKEEWPTRHSERLVLACKWYFFPTYLPVSQASHIVKHVVFVQRTIRLCASYPFTSKNLTKNSLRLKTERFPSYQISVLFGMPLIQSIFSYQILGANHQAKNASSILREITIPWCKNMYCSLPYPWFHFLWFQLLSTMVWKRKIHKF